MAGSAFFDVRMRGFRDRTEVADVLRLLDQRCRTLPSERVPLPDSAGRVMAEPVVAEIAVPGFDRAAMDGYAVCADETFAAGAYNAISLRVVGAALPGRSFEGVIGAGQAIRVMTGAPMPAGADAVIPAEAAEEKDGEVHIVEPISPGRHVGHRGEDIRPGQAVLSAGRTLRPQDLGLLASLGIDTVTAVRRPRVSILVTGDELLPCGAKPEGFRIVDSNSIMLAALTQRDGGVVAGIDMLPDHRDRIRHALLQEKSDVVLVTGGSSVGQEDHAPSLIAELGELPVHGVALRPAAPTGVGFIGDRIVFLMPGNPVSCLCAYDLFAGRAVRLLGGRGANMPYRVRRLRLAAKIVSAIGRVDYVRVRIVEDRVEPIAISGAALLSTTTAADGFVLVDRDREGHAAGEEVDVHLYDA